MGRSKRRKKEAKLEHAAVPPLPKRRTVADALREIRQRILPKVPVYPHYVPPIPMAPAPRFREVVVNYVPATRGEAFSRVYRFFPEEKFARQFLKGDIWISTLEKCRGYENKARGDAGEGTFNFHNDRPLIVNSDSDPEHRRALRSLGISVDSTSTLVMENCSSFNQIPDALVLCTTEQYNPEDLSANFGSYCVEITDPTEFFRSVSKALAERYNVGFCHMDRISYLGRHFSDLNLPKVHIGFLKPAEGYDTQKEVRMLWEIEGGNKLTPGMISVPQVAQYCRLIQVAAK